MTANKKNKEITNKISKNWLMQAESDLKSAKYNLTGKKLDIAAYLCQQSAEKALKSLYININNQLWKTHDLIKLAELLKAPKRIIDFCNELNPIYAEDRYPDYSDIIPAKKFQEEEIRGFLNKSKEVLKWTKENLKSLESSKNSKKKTKSKK